MTDIKSENKLPSDVAIWQVVSYIIYPLMFILSFVAIAANRSNPLFYKAFIFVLFVFGGLLLAYTAFITPRLAAVYNLAKERFEATRSRAPIYTRFLTGSAGIKTLNLLIKMYESAVYRFGLGLFGIIWAAVGFYILFG